MKHRDLFFVLIISAFLIITNCATVPKTPLIEAAIKGNPLAVEKLISNGANINEPDINGTTPLIHAIRAGKPEVAKHLIKSGADIKAKDKINDALLSAVEYGQIEIVNILLDRGANIESKDWAGLTPLAYTISCGHYDISKLLLQRGANIEAQDRSGATPLIYATRVSTNSEIIQLMINKGANCNAQDSEGYTPFYWAMYYKRMDIVAEIKKSIEEAFKGIPHAKIVFIREPNPIMPGSYYFDIVIDGRKVLFVDMNEASLNDNYIHPGKHDIVIKGVWFEGSYKRSFDAQSGKTYYFELNRRVGNVAGKLLGVAAAPIGGAAGIALVGIGSSLAESSIKGDKAGPIEIVPLEESVAKEKIKAINEKKK